MRRTTHSLTRSHPVPGSRERSPTYAGRHRQSPRCSASMAQALIRKRQVRGREAKTVTRGQGQGSTVNFGADVCQRAAGVAIDGFATSSKFSNHPHHPARKASIAVAACWGIAGSRCEAVSSVSPTMP